MNVFRSLVRSILEAIGLSKKSEEEEEERASSEVAPKKARAGSRPTFSPPARGDGFDAGARNRPLDLTGGVKLQFAAIEPVAEPPASVESDFEASLDDLGTLMEAQAAEQPVEPSSFAADPQDAFEPVDSFEDPSPVIAELMPPVSVEPVTPPEPLPQPAVVEQPIAAAVAPPPAATPQYTVQLLMPVAQERAAQPQVVEQFSTLELLDTVAQLTGDEEEPAQDPPPEPLPPG